MQRSEILTSWHTAADKVYKTKPSFYLMNTAADCKTIFKFLDAKLLVRRIRANPKIPLARSDIEDRSRAV